MKLFLLFLIILGLFHFARPDIVLQNIQGNLKCNPLTNGESFSSSSVGNQFRLNCNPQSNTYSRINFNAIINGNRTGRLEKTFFFSVIPGFGSQETMLVSDGCFSNAYTNTFYRKECVKMGLPIRLNNGNGYSIFPSSDSSQLARILNISSNDLAHIIEGYEIQFSFGWPVWKYQLSNNPDFVFPFAYSFHINNTFEAYNSTVSAGGYDQQTVVFGSVNNSDYYGTAPVFSNCYPSIQPNSERIGGYLGACFRAACNCSGVAGKPLDVPDYYTYEVDFVLPSGQVRKVLNNGQPRLSTDVVITFNAVVKLRGKTIFSEQMYQSFIPDITSKDFNGIGFGNTGSFSGVNNQENRIYSNINQALFGNGKVNIDNILFPAVQSANSLIKIKTSLNDAFLDQNNPLGGSLTKTGKLAAPILSGGYVIDFMTDNEVFSSVYRTSANSPYNTQGLPTQECVPPDSWFYLSDAQIRKGVYIGNHFRNSCGKLGTSSASFFTDNTLLKQYCCNDTLVSGKCLPGYGEGNFPSPEQIFNNCSLYVQDFTPPGYQAYNYYLTGRNTLNLQMPSQNVSGRDPLLFSAPSLVMDFSIEISDILLTGLVGNNAFNSNIPPLMLATSNDRKQWFVDDQPFGCIFDSLGGGIGVFFVQRLCNSGTNGGTANVSMGVENCQHITFFNESLVNEVFQILDRPLKNQECTQQTWTLPIKVDLNYYNNITCGNVFFSSTYGSTKEINIPNVKCYNIPGFFTHRSGAHNLTLPLYDCDNCECGDFNCWSYCQNYADNICWWFVFILPLTLFMIAMVVVTTVLIINYTEKNEKLQALKSMQENVSTMKDPVS